MLTERGAGVVAEGHKDRGEWFEGRGLRDPQEAIFSPNERVFRGGLSEEEVAEGVW